MPITQDRVLSLLAAAEDYKQALEQYWVVAQSTRQNVQSGRITAQQGFDLLALETRPEFLLKFPYDSPAVIKMEHFHFKRESKRNKRKAEKARENRAAVSAGMPKPDRGDGRNFGGLGGGRTKLEHELDIKPDPSLLLNKKQPNQITRPSSKSTDADQISADSDLTDLAEPTSSAINQPEKDKINSFLDGLEPENVNEG